MNLERVFKEDPSLGDITIGYSFYCPACNMDHWFPIENPVVDHPIKWGFNGDLDNPTFTPSLLVTEPDNPDYRCHLFVRGGNIEYCSDCNHGYAGKTIPLADEPE